ncbi:MAG: aminopeptidase [Candidatus Saliniplasma sp.]
MTKKEKSKLEEELSYKTKSIWEETDKAQMEEIFEFSEGYKEYITASKTERLAIAKSKEILDNNGFEPISEKSNVEPGDRVYLSIKNKAMAIAVIGQEPLSDGCNIVASHVDSPRIDIKARPLYEDKDCDLALFKTHYYGGIKKYQWVSTPLSIHGVVVKEDGETIEVSIGEREEDPVFVVSDLLPHLSRKEQGDRKMKDVIKGEELNLLVGGIPLEDEEVEQKIKLKILKHLNDKYDITEEDLTSAELEIVPAGKARDLGFDRSMIGGYGQDDRVCVYTSMKAAVDLDIPKRTSLVVLFDKEEIGSIGNTGAQSQFLKTIFSELLSRKEGKYTMEDYRKVVENSRAISADVDAGMNPTFKGVHDKRNAARLGKGIAVVKFTGAGGKFGGNDAHAEYVAFIRKIFNKGGVHWQTTELGKVDEGGGGTVASYLSRFNMDVIDAGPPVLGMHSPFEISSKADVFHSYRAYKIFLESD